MWKCPQCDFVGAYEEDVIVHINDVKKVDAESVFNDQITTNIGGEVSTYTPGAHDSSEPVEMSNEEARAYMEKNHPDGLEWAAGEDSHGVRGHSLPWR